MITTVSEGTKMETEIERQLKFLKKVCNGACIQTRERQVDDI